MKLSDIRYMVVVSLLLYGCSRSEPPGTQPEGNDAVIQTDQDTTEKNSQTAARNKPSDKPSDPQPPAAEQDPQTPLSPRAPIRIPEYEKHPEAADWIRKRADKDAKVRLEAAAFLDELGDRVVLHLIDAAQHTDPSVRAGAIFGLLARMNGSDPLTTETLVAALQDPDLEVQAIALRGISRLPEQVQAEAVPGLIAILLNLDHPPHIRAQAARLLGKIPTKDSGAFEAIRKALFSDPDADVRKACILGVVRSSPRRVLAVETLGVAVAKDTDPKVQRIAAERIMDYGKTARFANEQLIGALASVDLEVRHTAARTLAAEGKYGVADVSRALASDQLQVQLLAIRILGEIGPAAKPAREKIAKLAMSENQEVAAVARAALQRIGD